MVKTSEDCSMPTRFRKIRKFEGEEATVGDNQQGIEVQEAMEATAKQGDTNTPGPHYYRQVSTIWKTRLPSLRKNISTMNIGELNQLVDSFLSNGKAEKKEKGILID